MKQVSDTAIAMAALSICENLLATLMDRDILSREDIEELLTDAAEMQKASGNGNSQVNEEAADIIQDVLDSLVGEEDEEE